MVQSVRDVFPIKINSKLNLKMNVHKIYTRKYTMQVAICIPFFGSGLTAKKRYSHIPGKESFYFSQRRRWTEKYGIVQWFAGDCIDLLDRISNVFNVAFVLYVHSNVQRTCTC